MAGSSNPLPAPIQDLHYLYASNANVSNFVSVKLSGNHNYSLWKTQMLCLMESHDMCGIVDASFDPPRASSIKIWKQYDSLLKGWIFGSISEDVLVNVLHLASAKSVWEKLDSIYATPTINFQQDSAQTKPEAKEETQDIDGVSAESETETETKGLISTENETKTEKEKEEEDRLEHKKKLRKATTKGEWPEVKDMLAKSKDLEREELNSDGNTVLHLAVGIGHKDFVKNLLDVLDGEKILETKNKNGSTALHVAAIVGNKDAAELLVNRNKNLLTILDNEGQEPLLKAYSNMQFDTFIYLWNAAKGDDKTKQDMISRGPHIKKGVKLLVNAISAKQYSTALELVRKFPEFAVESDDVLMAIVKTFPSGLTNGEKLIYPSSLGDIGERITDRLWWLFVSLLPMFFPFMSTESDDNITTNVLRMILVCTVGMLIFGYQLIRILMWMVYLPFYMLYFLSWKVATRLVEPIKHIEKKKKEWEEANKVLELVCNKIDELKFSGTHHPHYTRPILEAACQNAYQVVDEILYRSPETIQSTDKNGYDIIQLAVIHRSEKIFNLIYQLGERKSRYRTFKDSSKNNILHLAGRLAPSHELNRRTGAALQLQRELQWREEVRKLVFPTYITKENIFKETPDMVFTREHKNLVKEGEAWMKTTAESCSITAALITTIVFAAAISVPGGSNEGTGIPVFTKDTAFTIFAISDAISLFTSSTSLLAFLSILTARFAEEDFLLRLPKRLIIGLCTLLLSATAMMVAFSATLFLVFCQKKPWMLSPICVFACLPIAYFFIVQCPLIVDLFQSTYGRTFSKKRKNSHHGRFNPNNVRGFFGK